VLKGIYAINESYEDSVWLNLH